MANKKNTRASTEIPQDENSTANTPAEETKAEDTLVVEETKAEDKSVAKNILTTANEKEGKVVEVKADVLDKLLSRMDRLEEDNKILRSASDKGRLSRIEALRAQGKLIKSAKVNFFNNEAVLGWHKIKDDVYFDEQGRLHETQLVNVITENNKDGVEVDYRTFARTMQKIEGEVISESKDKEGNVNYTIQLSDGREYTLDVRFIN